MLDGDRVIEKLCKVRRISMIGNAGGREFQFKSNLNLNAIQRLKKLNILLGSRLIGFDKLYKGLS